MKYNRKDYMDNKCSHDEYYSQFAGPSIIDLVGRAIGVDRIKRSSDPHFNDIPLKEWDSLNGLIRSYCGLSISESNASTCAPGSRGGISLSDTVCVAKAAAKIIKGVTL